MDDPRIAVMESQLLVELRLVAESMERLRRRKPGTAKHSGEWAAQKAFEKLAERLTIVAEAKEVVAAHEAVVEALEEVA